MYKIYINETPLLLVNEKAAAEKLPGDAENLVTRYSGKHKTLLNYADMLEKTNRYKSVTIFTPDVEQLFSDLLLHYDLIEAAGGLIFNPKNEVLMIYRRGFWDMAKGKIDPGETSEEAAVREVLEETGIEVKLGHFICHTYHTYRNQKDKRKLKRTYWYHMTTTNSSFKLQYEEDIEKGEWIKIEDFLNSERKVYSNILNVLKAGRMNRLD